MAAACPNGAAFFATRTTTMTDRTLRAIDLTRRGLFRDVALIAGAGALLGGGLAATSAAADTKFSQKMAHYQGTPKGAARCSNCSQFQPASACKVVAGVIAPAGWCTLYALKS
jgi:hypothetical protein